VADFEIFGSSFYCDVTKDARKKLEQITELIIFVVTDPVCIHKGQRTKVEAKNRLKDKYQYFIFNYACDI